MRQAVKHSYLLLYALFVLACARQTTPTGGPKDSIPPTLINSVPQQGQVNFKGNSITLTFSEAVILNNPREQLIVTPDLGKDVDARAKKNQIILSIPEDLQDNTTYSINFREAVQDITEKNPAEMLKLAFSTGNYIDSLIIEGSVSDLLTATEAKDATVALCESDTFDIFKHRPKYFTKSNSKGIFKIENLKPGNYFIYAFEDKNKNLVVDSKSEAYGFLSDYITLDKNIDDVKIRLIHLDSRPLKLTSARPYGTYYNIKTSKNLTDFKITTPEEETIISSFAEDFANIRIYNTFKNKDSLAIHFTGNDSVNNKIDTTLYAKFIQRDVRSEKFDVAVKNFNVIASKGIIQGELQFSKPLLSFNFDSIFFRIDSLQKISFTSDNIRWDSLRNQLFLTKAFAKELLPKEGSEAKKPAPFRTVGKQKTKTSISNQFYLGNAAFISIELDSSKNMVNNYVPAKLEDTAILLIEVQTKAQHFFVQLLTKDYQVITSRRNSKKFNFEDLKPGDYQIRLIIDENNDGKWSPGNFYKNQEPENVLFYRNEKAVKLINLKANWELGPLLIKD